MRTNSWIDHISGPDSTLLIFIAFFAFLTKIDANIFGTLCILHSTLLFREFVSHFLLAWMAGSLDCNLSINATTGSVTRKSQAKIK